MNEILIKGMEMPNKCGVCFLRFGQCKQRMYMGWRPDACPLIPLPEGHGRLIDADALFEKMYHLSDNEGAHKDSAFDDSLILRDSACYLIEDAPTIVPAEGGGEDDN